MNMQAQTKAELPRYRSHKQVWALKIAKIDYELACDSREAGLVCGAPKSAHTLEAARGDVGMDHDFIAGTFDAPGALITPAEEGYAPFRVSEEYIVKHNPQIGGYYVVYADGYESWSPAAAFEEGYTRV